MYICVCSQQADWHRELLEISSMNILYIFQYSSNISTLQGRFDQMIRRGVSTKGRKKPPLRCGAAAESVKKASQSLPPAGGKSSEIIFARGVYLGENTSQSASVEFVRFQRTNYARGRLQAFCQKRALPFFDSHKEGCLVTRQPSFGVKNAAQPRVTWVSVKVRAAS